MQIKSLATAAALAAGLATGATAQSQGDWTLGLGLGAVLPKSDNGTLAGAEADIDDGYALTITGEYFIRDNLGIEILAATPFEHDITLAGIGPAGSIKHLPPTVSLNYHFATASAWKPYVGVGINYTTFFDEQSDLGTLELDDSWGVAVQAGIDYQVNDTSALRANLRWIDIDTDATLNGASIGEAEIDPVVLNFAYVKRF